MIRDGGKKCLGPGYLLLQGALKLNHQTHAPGAVMGLIKLEQFVTDRAVGDLITQGLPVPDRELGEGMGRIDGLFMNLIRAADIVLQLQTVFRIDGVAFLVDQLGIEGWAGKKLGEA